MGESPETSADPGPVPTASIQAPSIYPLRLCCTEEARVRLGCLVKDYLPGSVTVTWDTVPLDGSTLTFPSIQMASSSLYITTSQLTISGEQPKEFTCRVLHAETNSNLNKTISTECAKNFSDPSVKLFYSSCNPNGDTQTTIHLLCRISGYTPGKIKVTWLVDGLKSEELYARSGPEIQEGNLTSTYSEVNITQGQWVSEKTYTCRVNYYGYNFESHAHRCTAESEPRGVSAYLSPPTPLELYVNKSPKITCLVVDLANEKNLSLTWSRANGKPVHAGPPEIKRQFNGTVTVTSTLPVDVTDWVEGETYYCKVSHSDLPTDIQRSISKDVGKRLAPKAYVFLPDGKELENEEELTLTCMIQKFFPRDIFVRWLHNKELMRADQHTTTQPHRADNNTPAFFAYSRLAVPRANWKRGDEFTCQVIHEALPRTRTLEKSVTLRPPRALVPRPHTHPLPGTGSVPHTHRRPASHPGHTLTPSPPGHILTPSHPGHTLSPRPYPHTFSSRSYPHTLSPRPYPHTLSSRPYPHTLSPRPYPHTFSSRPHPHTLSARPYPLTLSPRPHPLTQAISSHLLIQVTPSQPGHTLSPSHPGHTLSPRPHPLTQATPFTRTTPSHSYHPSHTLDPGPWTLPCPMWFPAVAPASLGQPFSVSCAPQMTSWTHRHMETHRHVDTQTRGQTHVDTHLSAHRHGHKHTDMYVDAHVDSTQAPPHARRKHHMHSPHPERSPEWRLCWERRGPAPGQEGQRAGAALHSHRLGKVHMSGHSPQAPLVMIC
uniref:Ig-like domain-containing protein n=1 Tax=Bos taurus TaxID=9913 RepID=A0AAA9U1D2_BOVIN